MMLWRAFKNYFSQAFLNLWRNRVMSLMATATIVFCLFLLGAAVILGLNLSYVSKQLEGQYEIHAYVNMSYSEEQAASLKGKIEAIDNVAKAEFISKQQALKDMEKSMTESASAFEMLEGDENPLPNTYNITLKDVRKATEVVSSLKTIEGISEVKNRSDILKRIVSMTRGAQIASILGMLIFAFVGIFIISNTIKMSVTARSREIEIMKYVGATDWYIRWPFVIEGAAMGAGGAILAYIPVHWGYSRLVIWWCETVSMFKLCTMNELKWTIILTFVAIGCFLGAFGSIISIRKHLRV
ncbi:MAG: permease-like cell division protein FtsX [Bacillota bacterium]|nr:permease-like cell division protein FtsX [Bacillota bacterium]